MTRRIPLTQGLSAFIDDADYELVAGYNWQAIKGWREGVFYAKTDFGDKTILMHRLLLNIHNELGTIRGDHIDGDGLNNVRENLRKITPSLNNMNKARPDSHNTSGRTGVSWNSQKQRWCAEIRFEGRRRHLGFFKNFTDACNAREKAEKEIWQTQLQRN